MRKLGIIWTLVGVFAGCRLQVEEVVSEAESGSGTSSVTDEAAIGHSTIPSVTPGEVLDPVSSERKDFYHEVKPGETLSQIADRYKTTASDLARVNGLGDPDRLSPGQMIYIPGRSGDPSMSKETTP